MTRTVLHVFLMGLMCACGSPVSNTTAPLNQPHVLIVTLDTTRADRLGPWGYEKATTPTYDKLAADGAMFSRAYTSCPLTIPSHSTLFTGRYPPSHGVRDNGDFILGDGAITLAERFKEQGYYTAAFTSAFPTQARWGFNQGFDVYHDPLKRLPTQLDWRDQRTADEVIEDALQTLKDAPEGKPQFVWLHLFDAHWPYEPPEPFKSAHKGRPYDGEIAFTDHQVGRFLEWWERDGRQAITVITADHGEGLGDGGEQTHGFLLHDPTMHIPLLIKGPGVKAGQVIDDPVGLVDVAPTVLSLAGLSIHKEIQGINAFEGGSDQIYAEALTAQFNLGLKPLYSYTAEEGRYMEGGWGGWYEHKEGAIATTPSRITTDKERAILAEMRENLEEVIAPDATLGVDEFEMLAALGYTEGTPGNVAGDVDPRDVIDKIPLTWGARQAIGRGQMKRAEKMIVQLEAAMPDTFGVQSLRASLLRRQGQLVDSLIIYESLFESAQASSLAMQIAGIYTSLNMWQDAERYFQSALELQPNNAQAMAGLVKAARELDEPEKAADLADQFLTFYPEHAELSLIRAEMYLAQGRNDEAVIDAKRALDKMPYSPWAYTTYAQALWEVGDSERAIESLQDALRLSPINHFVRMRLGECLLEVRRNAEATRISAPLARMMPDDPIAQDLYQRASQALAAEREQARTVKQSKGK
jgi:arylsulfatase A-like enzyme/Flp pilus assembly protein TadD